MSSGNGKDYKKLSQNVSGFAKVRIKLKKLKRFFQAIGAAEPAEPFGNAVVVNGNAVGQEHALREGFSRVHGERFIAAVGHLDKDMTFVVGVKVVAVDNAHGIIERKAVLETETGTREYRK